LLDEGAWSPEGDYLANVPLFSGATRADVMEAELHKATGHVRS
jgi:hypothetical protein